MNISWGDLVAERTQSVGELVVGIDPVQEDIPNIFKDKSKNQIESLDRYIDFIIEKVFKHVGFVKFQSAFFEAFGSGGLQSLAKGISNARHHKLGIILDAKRGDIGSTSAAYAKAYLTPLDFGGSDLEVDCMTINPFLGPETLEPFINCARRFGKGIFVLAKTSNPGAGWLQDEEIDGSRVSERIAKLVGEWASETKGNSGLSAVGAVVGATFPEDGRRLRELMPNSVFLAPGIGSQGGEPKSIQALRRNQKDGVLVPVSRGITKVDDLTISFSSYEETIVGRVKTLQSSLL